MPCPAHRNDEGLRSDIRIPGSLLGDVIQEQRGDTFFEPEEEARLASRALREIPDFRAQEKMYERLEDASLWEAIRLARYWPPSNFRIVSPGLE